MLKIANKACFRKDCGKAGWWKPILLVWAAGYPKDRYPPATLELGFLLCKKHRREFQFSDVIDALGWIRIEAAFAAVHKAIPDRESIEVRWERIPGEG